MGSCSQVPGAQNLLDVLLAAAPLDAGAAAAAMQSAAGAGGSGAGAAVAAIQAASRTWTSSESALPQGVAASLKVLAGECILLVENTIDALDIASLVIQSADSEDLLLSMYTFTAIFADALENSRTMAVLINCTSLALSFSKSAFLDCVALWLHVHQDVPQTKVFVRQLTARHLALDASSQNLESLVAVSPALAHEILCHFARDLGHETAPFSEVHQQNTNLLAKWIEAWPTIVLPCTHPILQLKQFPLRVPRRSTSAAVGIPYNLVSYCVLHHEDQANASSAQLHAALLQSLGCADGVRHGCVLKAECQIDAASASGQMDASEDSGGLPPWPKEHCIRLIHQAPKEQATQGSTWTIAPLDRLAQALAVAWRHGAFPAGESTDIIAGELSRLKGTRLLHAVLHCFTGTA